MLQSNQTLKRLDLSWNQFRLRGAQALAAALPDNIGLETLILGWNGFADVGAVALAEAIKRNENLVSLSLTNNRITLAGCTALAKALSAGVNSTLTHLNLSLNPIESGGVNAMLDAALANVHLAVLDFSFVPVEPEVRERITNLTTPSPKLVEARRALADSVGMAQSLRASHVRLARADAAMRWAQDCAADPSCPPHKVVAALALADAAEELFARLASSVLNAAYHERKARLARLQALVHPLGSDAALVTSLAAGVAAEEAEAALATARTSRAPSARPVSGRTASGRRTASARARSAGRRRGYPTRMIKLESKELALRAIREAAAEGPVQTAVEDLARWLEGGAISRETAHFTCKASVGEVVLDMTDQRSATPQTGATRRQPAGGSPGGDPSPVACGDTMSFLPASITHNAGPAYAYADAADKARAAAEAEELSPPVDNIPQEKMESVLRRAATIVAQSGGAAMELWTRAYMEVRRSNPRDRAGAIDAAAAAAAAATSDGSGESRAPSAVKRAPSARQKSASAIIAAAARPNASSPMSRGPSRGSTGRPREETDQAARPISASSDTWAAPAGWETLAQAMLAVEAGARQLQESRDEEILLDALNQSLLSLDATQLCQRADVMEALAAAAHAAGEVQRGFAAALEEADRRAAEARDARTHCMRQETAAVDNEVNENKRPHLTVLVDDGGGGDEPTTEPWVVLEAYLERHSLRLVDILKRFDPQDEGEVTREDFIRAIKVCAVLGRGVVMYCVEDGTKLPRQRLLRLAGAGLCVTWTAA
jgi:hypothetical protein